MNQWVYIYFVRTPLLVLLALLCIMGAFSKRGWVDWRRMVKKNQEMRERIDEVFTSKTDLEKKLVALKSDSAEQERVVRELLGYVRPAERVIEFP